MRLKIVCLVLIVVLMAPFFPAKAALPTLPFGGKIVSSMYRTCNIYIGIATVPFPLQVMRIYRAGVPKTIVYPYYALLLQIFGITTSIYSYAQIYRAGPNVLGQYVPAPIPWVDCPDLYPTNIITKIGTSLF